MFLHRIGSKTGRVISIDRNTKAMSRGQYVRFIFEVDVSKPLLSKFRLNGRVWRIQYEGLKQICFKCGRLGHKEHKCSLQIVVDENGEQRLQKIDEPQNQAQVCSRPEESDQFGSWMLVQRTNRKNVAKTKVDPKKQPENNKSKGAETSAKGQEKPKVKKKQVRNSNLGQEGTKQKEGPSGSRFMVLDQEEDMEINEEDLKGNPTKNILKANVNSLTKGSGNILNGAINLGEDISVESEDIPLQHKSLNEMEIDFVSQSPINLAESLHKDRSSQLKIKDMKSSLKNNPLGINKKIDFPKFKENIDPKISDNYGKDILKSFSENPKSYSPPVIHPDFSIASHTPTALRDHSNSSSVKQDKLSSSPNYFGEPNPPIIHNVHGLPEGRTNSGSSPSPSEQRSSPSEYVPTTETQSPGYVVHSRNTNEN
ncbi:uncharacterized protein LOC110722189 [Chenopodium quinoa]|uniref:uncharacterized protein LOC110722189 n=1 Tax=Chenopodium quinoa TaxID=63459 RepID=UPI000B793A10|nr:uncharacterized protein LOC110722189 [Chenopodium quinoa]